MDTSNKAEKHKKTLKHCVWAIKLRMKQKKVSPLLKCKTRQLKVYRTLRFWVPHVLKYHVPLHSF